MDIPKSISIDEEQCGSRKPRDLPSDDSFSDLGTWEWWNLLRGLEARVPLFGFKTIKEENWRLNP